MSLLALKATTPEECDVISTLFQDSIFHFQYHFMDESSDSFHLMLNRFCWEDCNNGDSECYFRVHSAMYIHNVKSIKVNIDFQNNRHNYLSLLAIHANDNEVNILFADNKHICVEVSSLLVYAKDLHEKYPTLVKPAHMTLH